MAAFTWTSTIDSKGRVTVPAEIRNKLDINKGDDLQLSITQIEIIREEIKSLNKAIEFLSNLEEIESFTYDGEILEVIKSD